MKSTSQSSPTGIACCWAWRPARRWAPWAPWPLTQNQRQVKRTARKLAKGAEHAICQLDKMVDNFVEQHMDS